MNGIKAFVFVLFFLIWGHAWFFKYVSNSQTLTSRDICHLIYQGFFFQPAGSGGGGEGEVRPRHRPRRFTRFDPVLDGGEEKEGGGYSSGRSFRWTTGDVPPPGTPYRAIRKRDPPQCGFHPPRVGSHSRRGGVIIPWGRRGCHLLQRSVRLASCQDFRLMG